MIKQDVAIDLSRVVRALSRSPRHALAAVVMLALGIGLSVAAYSVLKGILLSSLPMRDGASVWVLSANHPGERIEGAQFTTEEALALSAGVPGFERIAYYLWYSVGVFDGERGRNLTAHVIGPGYFAALGVEPVLGRLPSDEEIRAGSAVALISHSEWQRQYFGATDVIGKRLDLIDDAPLEIIGVLPPAISAFADSADLWRPLPDAGLWQGETRRTLRTLMLVARVHHGTSVAQAEAALAARMASLPRTENERGWRVTARSLLDQIIGDVRMALWSALGLAVLVLVIGATNFALLLEARRIAGQRDDAVRQALGASTARLARIVRIELMLISAAAVVLGASLALVMVGGSRRWLLEALPRAELIQVDLGAIAFAVCLGLMLPLLILAFGVLRRSTPLSWSFRSHGRFFAVGGRRWLPSLAVALATVSVVTAIGLGFGLWRLQSLHPGYRAEHVQVLQIFRIGQEAFVPFAETMIDRLAAIPGVEHAAMASSVPLSDIGSSQSDVRRPERDDVVLKQAGMRKVSAGYRELLEIPLLAGRDFNANDRYGAKPVALLSASAAERLFPGESAIGRTIERTLGAGGWSAHEVVGVVGDSRHRGLREQPAPEILLHYPQSPRVGMSFLVRTKPGVELGQAIVDTLHDVDPRQPVTAQFALDAALNQQLRPATLFASAAAIFAVLSLALAALGLYALASLEQRGRLPEYGLRAAIGARPRQLLAQALTSGFSFSVTGAVIGSVMSFALFQVLDFTALGVGRDTVVLALAIGIMVMTVIALAASCLPALRAARADPARVLLE